MGVAENLVEPGGSACAAAPRVRLRPVTQGDCQLLWEWSNDSTVRAYSFESEPITFAEHRRWLGRKIADPQCRFFIALNEYSVAIGQVRYDLEEDRAIVSVSVDERLRGQNYGKEIIRASGEAVFAETDVSLISAFIKPENEVSIRVFGKCGYRMAGSVTIHGQPALRFIRERNR
jgi:UDP-2,4-diacetamido-2,4,6-trideoxy-beta-L-altropyranose hydrolase